MSGVNLSFFFSSRRRHTRFDCDWSSDVCSSDLPLHSLTAAVQAAFAPQGLLSRAEALFLPREGQTRMALAVAQAIEQRQTDRKSTRLNSSHSQISYAVFCLKKKNTNAETALAYH